MGAEVLRLSQPVELYKFLLLLALLYPLRYKDGFMIE
jgi:hypothetical protein